MRNRLYTTKHARILSRASASPVIAGVTCIDADPSWLRAESDESAVRGGKRKSGTAKGAREPLAWATVSTAV
jgi:hypothetical protein